MKSLKIGSLVEFRSWAYPSMKGMRGIVKGMPDADYDFVSVAFLGGKRMACRESELVVIAWEKGDKNDNSKYHHCARRSKERENGRN